jgi:hypothetical protein
MFFICRMVAKLRDRRLTNKHMQMIRKKDMRTDIKISIT